MTKQSVVESDTETIPLTTGQAEQPQAGTQLMGLAEEIDLEMPGVCFGMGKDLDSPPEPHIRPSSARIWPAGSLPAKGGAPPSAEHCSACRLQM